MWGLFNDDSADWTEEEAVESGFADESEAMAAMVERYTEEDELIVHRVEEPEESEEDETEEE